jgi:hypothetical protein
MATYPPPKKSRSASMCPDFARGVFTSVPDLARKLRRYINAYSANAQPINWKYSDPSHRVRSNDLSATCH